MVALCPLHPFQVAVAGLGERTPKLLACWLVGKRLSAKAARRGLGFLLGDSSLMAAATAADLCKDNA